MPTSTNSTVVTNGRKHATADTTKSYLCAPKDDPEARICAIELAIEIVKAATVAHQFAINRAMKSVGICVLQLLEKCCFDLRDLWKCSFDFIKRCTLVFWRIAGYNEATPENELVLCHPDVGPVVFLRRDPLVLFEVVVKFAGCLNTSSLPFSLESTKDFHPEIPGIFLLPGIEMPPSFGNDVGGNVQRRKKRFHATVNGLCHIRNFGPWVWVLHCPRKYVFKVSLASQRFLRRVFEAVSLSRVGELVQGLFCDVFTVLS